MPQNIEHGGILPGRGVCYVDDHGGTLQRIGQSAASNAVDTGRGRRGHYFLPLIMKLLDKLRPNEPSTTNDYEFHDCPFAFERGNSNLPVIR